MFTLSGFDVVQCNQNFRLSDSILTIRFNVLTNFDALTAPISPILEELFRFRDLDSLLGLANTKTQLPGVIGELAAVKSTVSDIPQGNERIMATIKSISRMLLKATSETHAGEFFLTRKFLMIPTLASRHSWNNPASSLLRGYTKVEPLSISELTKLILTAKPQVTGIKMERGWCYVSCFMCTRRLQRTVSSFTCVSRNNTKAIGVLRYRVEMSIADDTMRVYLLVLMALASKKWPYYKALPPVDAKTPSGTRSRSRRQWGCTEAVNRRTRPPNLALIATPHHCFRTLTTGQPHQEDKETTTVSISAELKRGRRRRDRGGEGKREEEERQPAAAGAVRPPEATTG
ncbi:hypothetical protein F2Q69_00047312 [Brassica cretica]|uniref:Uncharacterized protein n=1 Tax=Brassica cretica TaxID=69181 RepID=A0A8S9PM22_BRACR|nr:hypothetical protein F2Q69_00047312 [Brassica cretica]